MTKFSGPLEINVNKLSMTHKIILMSILKLIHHFDQDIVYFTQIYEIYKH